MRNHSYENEISIQIELIFMKCFARRLVLKQRLWVFRKWSEQPLHKWRLNLNNITLTSLASHSCFQTQNFTSVHHSSIALYLVTGSNTLDLSSTLHV